MHPMQYCRQILSQYGNDPKKLPKHHQNDMMMCYLKECTKKEKEELRMQELKNKNQSELNNFFNNL